VCGSGSKAGEPLPLYRGPVRLVDGRVVDGIPLPRPLAEGRHKDVSQFGDWRAYVASLRRTKEPRLD
jgi:hypothetical protein